MQRKGLLIVGGDANDRANRSKNDFYETPQIAIDCLMTKETFKSVILEPCAGKGAISELLASKYHKTVISNDIKDYGYPLHIQSDILTLDNTAIEKAYNGTLCNYDIITNPPYCMAEPIIKKCISLVNNGCKVACLLRIQFLEGISRYNNLFKDGCLKSVYVFTKRVSCYKSEEYKNKSSAICFAWFVFEKGYKGKPVIDWINTDKEQDFINSVLY